jgi:hypothetical protein
MIALRQALVLGVAAAALTAAAAAPGGCSSGTSNATPGMVVDRGPNSPPYVIKYRRITDHKELWEDVSARGWANCPVGAEYPNCANR